MQSNKRNGFPRLSGTLLLPGILLAWTSAIIFGAAAGRLFAFEHTSWMRQALFSRVSIVGAVMCNVLPILFTAAAAFLGSSWLIYFLSGIKGFGLGFTGAACVCCFGGAGWLVKLLLLFPQPLCAGLLWWMWLRLCRGARGIPGRGFGLLLMLALANAAAFYFGAAPFLSRLIEK